MSDLLRFNDLFRVGRDEAVAQQSALSVDVIDRDGSEANTLIAVDALTADQNSGQLAEVQAALYLDSAEGQALDRLLFDRYGLPRKASAPALGSVNFTTTAPNPASFNIPAGVIVATAGGVQFITAVATIFPAGVTNIAAVPVRSILAGLSQRTKIGQITSIVSTIPGSPADLAVNNPLATSGGDDDELDPQYRNRGRQFFSSARRGTLAAIQNGALAVPGVRSASAIEVTDTLGRPARVVLLTVADAFTDQFAAYSSPPPSYMAQSQQLAATVFADLDDVRAAGIFVNVVVAEVVLQPIVLNLAFLAGVDVDAVALRARATAVAFVNGLLPGGSLSVQQLGDAVRTTRGLSVTGNEIFSPAGRVVANPLQVIRTSLAIVSASVGGTLLQTSNNPDAFLS